MGDGVGLIICLGGVGECGWGVGENWVGDVECRDRGYRK